MKWKTGLTWGMRDFFMVYLKLFLVEQHNWGSVFPFEVLFRDKTAFSFFFV